MLKVERVGEFIFFSKNLNLWTSKIKKRKKCGRSCSYTHSAIKLLTLPQLWRPSTFADSYPVLSLSGANSHPVLTPIRCWLFPNIENIKYKINRGGMKIQQRRDQRTTINPQRPTKTINSQPPTDTAFDSNLPTRRDQHTHQSTEGW